MPRFFSDAISGTQAVLTGEDAAHVARSLRMHPGEELTLCDGKGTDYRCAITEIQPDLVQLQVLQSCPSLTEPSLFVRLYMALPKGEKFELIVQKAVELGVGEIVPVLTHRCISRPDAKSMQKKLQRYNRIALEAAKQSMRGRVPQVRQLLTFEQAVQEMQQADNAVLFYERSTASMQQILKKPGKTFAVMIGAEGGFEESEVEYARQQGIASLTLGPRILRCETAPLAALSVLMYATGNFDTPQEVQQ